MKTQTFFAILLLSTLLSACAGNNRNSSSGGNEAAEINMRLGLNYMQRGDYAFALEKLEKALQQDPNLPSAHNTIAILYQRLGEDEKAGYHFEKAVDLAPEYSEAQNNYGAFLCQQQRFDEAEKRFLLAVENPLYQSAAQAYENAGLCAMQAQQVKTAENYFRRALQIEPTLRKSLLQMAEISYQQQNYLQARGYIQRFHDAATWTARALLLGIKTENKLGDEDAIASYILILRSRFPDSDEMQMVNQGIENL
ncbi:MAG: type IV pilus biogenesis/stability protein PilW [Methylophaga sp.]|nr:type IV pilus biogenesis/stability protein PilW [Methylophaga sp.]